MRDERDSSISCIHYSRKQEMPSNRPLSYDAPVPVASGRRLALACDAPASPSALARAESAAAASRVNPGRHVLPPDAVFAIAHARRPVVHRGPRVLARGVRRGSGSAPAATETALRAAAESAASVVALAAVAA